MILINTTNLLIYSQVYCNIVAGACFSIGLRYAGSTDKDACDTIIHYAKELTKFGSKSIGELAGKSTIETCLNLVLISAAMVNRKVANF